MVGIRSFGGYVPRYRLSREEMARAWGARALDGERSVAGHDEDVVTMSTEAAINALARIDAEGVDAVYFASTTAPYLEKQSSTLVATVCALPRTIFTADFAGSLRSGTAALRAALDAVKAGSARNALVVASDVRVGEPTTDLEQVIGDSGAALVVSDEGVIAELERVASVSEEFTDVWRQDSDLYPRVGDPKFIQTYGYGKMLREALQAAASAVGLENVTKVVFGGSSPRDHAAMAKALGLKPEQLQPPLLSQVGDTGSSAPLMLFITALEEAGAGDTILVGSYGTGVADAFLFRVTEAIVQAKTDRGVCHYVNLRRPLANYEKYLRFRRVIPEAPVKAFTSFPILWKEIKQDLQLTAVKCRECGQVTFPRVRICERCNSKDNFEDRRLVGVQGTVYTFTKDHLVPDPDAPVVTVVADMEGGGRLFLQLTDCDKDKVAIGMRVEPVFRKIHEGGDFNNYFWKFRPVD